MARSKRGSSRGDTSPAPADAGESGGFLGQLGLAETGGTSPGLIGVAIALALAIATYPIAWLVRRWRRQA